MPQPLATGSAYDVRETAPMSGSSSCLPTTHSASQGTCKFTRFHYFNMDSPMAKTIRMISPSGTSVYTKDGFSWPAFFFGPIWALVKKAWRDFFVLERVAAQEPGAQGLHTCS